MNLAELQKRTWIELKKECASDPANAVRLVVVREHDVNNALARVFTRIIEQEENSTPLICPTTIPIK